MNVYFFYIIFDNKIIFNYYIECDNTICATCSNIDTNCTSLCNDGCVTCDPTGKCIGGICKDTFVFNSISGDCDPCD